MKHFAIYTAIIGGYDIIQQPKVVDERFDYILFTDNVVDEQIGVWQVRKVDYKNNVQVKIARYVKTHPHVLLPEYKATLWIDASVVIETDFVYQRAVELYECGCIIAAHVHPERDCIYDEMFAVMAASYEDERIVLKWGHYLRKRHYPRHNGLCETGALFRLNVDSVRLFNDKWWSYIDRYSRRDQLSFNYVAYELSTPLLPFMPKNKDIQSSGCFIIQNHHNVKAKYDSIPNNSWLVKYYRKHPSSQMTIKNVYYRIYLTHCPSFWSRFWGQVFRIKDIVSRYKRSLFFN